MQAHDGSAGASTVRYLVGRCCVGVTGIASDGVRDGLGSLFLTKGCSGWERSRHARLLSDSISQDPLAAADVL